MKAILQRIAFTLLALAAIVALVEPAAASYPAPALPAQVDDEQPGEPNPIFNPFLTLFPALKQSPAPSWLKEGHRATYYVQGANIPQDGDEDGTGGAGYAQYDVVALDKNNVVSSLKLYSDQGNSIVTPLLNSAIFGVPGAGDYWLHASALENAEDVANDELTVVHMPTTIAGEEYQAVRFQYETGGATYVWVFDAESGLLLFYRHEIGGEGAAHKQLADMTLVGARQLKLPWKGRSIPDWAERGLTTRYDGVSTVVIPGTDDVQFATSVETEIARAQPRWTSYKAAAYTAGQFTGVSERVTGVAQLFDAFWLPATALSARVRRPLLDRDPITGAEVTYARTADVIALTETGDAYYTILHYDARTGQLIAMRQESQNGFVTNVVELELAP